MTPYLAMALGGVNFGLTQPLPDPFEIGNDFRCGSKLEFLPPDEIWQRAFGEAINGPWQFVLLKRFPQSEFLPPKDLYDPFVSFMTGLAIATGEVPTFGNAFIFRGPKYTSYFDVSPQILAPIAVAQPFSDRFCTRSGKFNVSLDNLCTASHFPKRLSSLLERRDQRNDPKYCWRVWHGIGALSQGMRLYYGEDRIHQFIRAIESFLPSDVKGADKFSERVSEIVGNDPRYTQDKLKQMYNLRSASEHHFRFEDHERFQSISGISVAMAESLATDAEKLCLEFYRRLFLQIGENEFFSMYGTTDVQDQAWRFGTIKQMWKKASDESISGIAQEKQA